jgi:hypothetical protein
MACTSSTGRRRHGGNSWRAVHGQGGRGRGANATIPRKASEVGAYKELEGHIFTIGSGNKGKDGDMLRTSMEKMATYISIKFGDEAAQEWISARESSLLSLPTYKPSLTGM